jgi:hypothetical protein
MEQTDQDRVRLFRMVCVQCEFRTLWWDNPRSAKREFSLHNVRALHDELWEEERVFLLDVLRSPRSSRTNDRP